MATFYKPENNSERFCGWLLKRFKNFCVITTLHGFIHIGRQDVQTKQRVTWGIMTLAAWSTAIAFLYLSLNNSSSDTLMVIESTHHGIWNIPFPAVTICNINRISRKAAVIMARKMRRPKDITAEDVIRILRTLVTAYHSFGANTTHSTNQLEELLSINNHTVESIMQELAPTCKNLIQRCMWKSNEVNCDSIFQTVVTSSGFCCSFNYYGRKHNFAPKYAYTFPHEPKRVSSCGYQTALSVLIEPDLVDYHTTLISSFGSWVSIHDPYDFPDENAEMQIVSSEMEVYLSITPEATYATETVRALSVDRRKCLFKDEDLPSHLRQFRVMEKYSYLNCLVECRSQMAYDKCTCVPYNFPHTNGTRACDVTDWSCLRLHNQSIFGSLPGMTIQEIAANETYSPCGCLPDCELFEYPTEASSGKISKRKDSNSLGIFKKSTYKEYSIVHVFFSDLKCTHFRRDVVMNWYSLMATCGGLLGLFVGFSIISGFEFVYFFTLRVIFDKYAKDPEENKTEKQDALEKTTNFDPNLISKKNISHILNLKKKNKKVGSTLYKGFNY